MRAYKAIRESIRHRRRFAPLRSRPARHLSSRRHLCRSHSARREAGRSPGAASNEIRDGRKPGGRHGARPCCTPIDSGARGPGDRSVGCGRGGLLSFEKADEKCSSCDPHSNLERGGARSQTQERAAGTFHKVPHSPGGAGSAGARPTARRKQALTLAIGRYDPPPRAPVAESVDAPDSSALVDTARINCS